MRLIVDRIENGILTCVKDNKEIITFQLADYKIIDNIREGDSVYIRNNGILVDYKDTKENKKVVDKLCRDMWDD